MPRKRKTREPTEQEIQMKQLIELAATQRNQNQQKDPIWMQWHRRRRGIPEPPHEPYIVFERGNHGERMSLKPADDQLVVIVPNEVYVRFIRLVYLATVVAILLTSTTMLCLCLLKTDVAKAILVPYYVWVIGAGVLIVFAATCPPMRRSSPTNWIFAVLIVILLTFAAAYCGVKLNWILLFIAMILSSMMVIFCLVAGVNMPMKWLPGGPISTIVLVAVALIFIIVIFVCILMPRPVHTLVAAVFGLFLVLARLIIHAEYVHGRRTSLPFMSMPFCALTIYVAYLLILLALYIFYRIYRGGLQRSSWRWI